MKTIRMIVMITGMLWIHAALSAQEQGDKQVVTSDRQVDSFTGVDAGGAATLYLELADACSVVVETDENLQDNVTTEVSNNILYVKSTGMRNPTRLNVYVKLPALTSLDAHGATEVIGKSVFQAEEMKVTASGAASAKLALEAAYLKTAVSGAADLKLSGKANTHHLEVSGAGSLDARELETRKAVYSVSGAADAKLFVTEDVSGTRKGSADISWIGNPKSTTTTQVDWDDSDRVSVTSDCYYDSVKVKVGKIKVEVYDGDDSVKVIIGDRELKVDDEGNVKFSRNKRPKFNGNWAGFEMGFNGYVDKDFNQSFPPEFEYLELQTTKSEAVHLNFFEQNIALARNQKWGLVTGLGINWNNYRFDPPTRLDPDSSYLVGYRMEGISIRKSKFTALYLNVPLLIEFQTNRWHKKNSFHIGLGMIASARLSSHTKIYYDEYNKEYELYRYSSEAGEYVPVDNIANPVSPDYSKAKNFDDYHLQPFKFDATVRIGWGFVNLFATYSVNQMFKEGKGPELYPWTAGITLVNF